MMFIGREMAHTDRGREVLLAFASRLEDLAAVESLPRMEGRHLSLVMVPKQTG